jgi:hypothetical protein
VYHVSKEIKDMVINIKGYDVLIDDEDYERIMAHTWQVGCPSGKPYFFFGKRSNGERHYTKLHRFLINAPKGSVVDHISGNVLDNRKCNLRITDWTGNARNHGIAKSNTSGFRGVVKKYNRETWIAQISLNHKTIRLGTFPTKEIAALVYETATKALYGEYYRDLGIDTKIELPIDHIPDCKLSKNGQGYYAKIKYDGHTHYLSRYKTEAEAQLAYKKLRAEIDLKRVLENTRKRIARLAGYNVNLSDDDIESTRPNEGLKEYTCKHCDKKFLSKKKNVNYCSKKCSAIARYEEGRYKTFVHVCPVCLKSFKGLKKSVYCSKKCACKVNGAKGLASQAIKGGNA